MKGDILSFLMRHRSMICSKRLQRYGMRIRDEFGSGFVGIKCFCMATFVSVARKLQHLWQIWIIYLKSSLEMQSFDTPWATIPLRNSRQSESEPESIGTEHFRPGCPNSSLMRIRPSEPALVCYGFYQSRPKRYERQLWYRGLVFLKNSIFFQIKNKCGHLEVK